MGLALVGLSCSSLGSPLLRDAHMGKCMWLLKDMFKNQENLEEESSSKSLLEEQTHSRKRQDLWSHLFVKTGPKCCDEDLEKLKPSFKEAILCGIEIVLACMNIFFYMYNIVVLPEWETEHHLLVSKHVVAWIEVVFVCAALLVMSFHFIKWLCSGSGSLIVFTTAMKAIGNFSCLKLLPLVEPGKVLDILTREWKYNASALELKKAAVLWVFLWSLGLAVLAALGLSALQVKLSQVDFVAQRSPDNWTWEELLRFLCFANNLMSMNDLDMTRMDFLAGIVQDGTRFWAWKEIVIERMAHRLTPPQFFAFCATLSPEKLAAQIIGVQGLEPGSRVCLAVPSVLPEGSEGTICQLKPLMV